MSTTPIRDGAVNVFKSSVVLATLCLIPIAGLSSVVASEREKILIVFSGEGREQGDARHGYEFDELSQAWLIFRNHGIDVEVASPLGGAVEADRYNVEDRVNAELLADASAMSVLANPHATSELNPEDYAAAYVVGGKSAMFDLPIAEAHSRLGNTSKARDMLRSLLARTPDMPEAKAMLDQLGN